MQRNGTTTPEGSAFGSKWRDRFGPGLLVTAAFIGPGTVATASVIGASYGFALTWALAFSVVATIILQEMSARLGLVTGAGLGESLRSTFSGRIARPIVVVLVIAAIGIGNAAFQTGNIMGGAVGLELLTPVSHKWWALVVGLAAALILAFGGYRRIELLLVGLVGVMSVVFVLTAIMTRPDIRVVLDGIFKPRLPSGSLTTVLALIGTTVVPYNLFLHASAVAEKWGGAGSARQYIRHARIDTIVSVSIGGIITLAIMSTAAMLPAGGKGITNAAAMAEQLEPLLGASAKWFFALGLFAAGLTSAVTAPLAAAYATAGMLGWEADMRSPRLRAVWATVIAIGMACAVIGESPVKSIIFAQAANGILLPIVAVFLLIAVNRRQLLGSFTNGTLANILGSLVILTAAGLGATKLWDALTKLITEV